MLKIEKRAKLDVKELVLITSENLQEVAEWCGGIATQDCVEYIDTTYDGNMARTALVGDYMEKRDDGYQSWAGNFIKDFYNLNEQGELIK